MTFGSPDMPRSDEWESPRHLDNSREVFDGNPDPAEQVMEKEERNLRGDFDNAGNAFEKREDDDLPSNWEHQVEGAIDSEQFKKELSSEGIEVAEDDEDELQNKHMEQIAEEKRKIDFQKDLNVYDLESHVPKKIKPREER